VFNPFWEHLQKAVTKNTDSSNAGDHFFTNTHKIKNCIQRGKRIWVIYCGTGVHLEEKKYIIIGISSKSA
jgi:hypothetical protein